MKYLIRTLMAVAILGAASAQLAFDATTVHAAGWSHSNQASVQRCKEFRSNGAGYWKGTFRMQPANVSSPNQPTFTITDCFGSKSECDRFISDARYNASGFVENRYYGCKRKS